MKFIGLKQIGKGGNGTVYVATTDSNATVAVKCVQMYKEGSNGVCITAIREAAALKTLKHQHIVELIEIMPAEDTLLFVMELCTGGNLRQLITSSKTKIRVSSYTHQLIGAVAYMHGRRISHRDIKPDNILLNGVRTVKLCCFGSSRFMHSDPFIATDGLPDRAEYTAKCTTLSYASPEQLIADKYYNPFKLDAWSLGCVIVEMIQRKVLVSTAEEVEELKTTTKTSLCPDHLPAANIVSVARGMLCVAPEARITVAEARIMLGWYIRD